MKPEEYKRIDFAFWERYVKANEIERHDMLYTLPLLKGAEKKGYVRTIISATLLQSYFDDLINYLRGYQNEQKDSETS
jgi:hypothetical protein